MSQRSGINHRVSRFRRLAIDLMDIVTDVPSSTIDRPMNLAPLVAARRARTPKPTWAAIFAKAYSLVATRRPELRTSYLKFPWPRFYEHYNNVVAVNVDRKLDDERVLIYALVRNPEDLSLDEIDDIVRRHKEDPISTVRSHRKATILSRIPWPLRKLLLWGVLNVSGQQRCRSFGTAGLSSVGAYGGGIVKCIPIQTTTLTFGLFDESGTVEARLTFDHRVFDGAPAAETLVDMERVLLGEILNELSP
jgi:pyruvate/2-oxoglutarate dehydrogenase complex dihydrolipoamide acyltransferase (E2) component